MFAAFQLACLDPRADHTLQQRTSAWLRYIRSIPRPRFRFRRSLCQCPGFRRSLHPDPSIVLLQLHLRSLVCINQQSFIQIQTNPRHSNRRGETVILTLSLATLAYVFNRTFTEISNQGLRYFGVVWTQTFGTFAHPLNIAWLSLTCTDSEERALAMAM